MATGLFGGTFDPPHNGHIALAEAAVERLPLERLVVMVVGQPGHRAVHCDAQTRLLLTRLAFPQDDVELDENPRTIDTLRERRWPDPVFLIGADQFAELLEWKEPDELLEYTRLGVATRPGYPRELLEAVLARLRRPEQVEFFELEPVPISSTEIRTRVARDEPIDGLVPAPVAAEIERLGLYRG